MLALAAIAQANALEAAVVDRRQRHRDRTRRQQREGSKGLVSFLRRRFADAADDFAPPWLPRFINYPY
jgi:hypothetical protein